MNTNYKIKDKCSNSKYYILVEKDLFHIATRLKNIDNGYFILYNTKKNKYEVHNHNNLLGTYCFSVPYKTLDARTYYYALETRIENSDKLYLELEKEKEKKQKLRKEEFKREIQAIAYDTRSIFMKEERM